MNEVTNEVKAQKWLENFEWDNIPGAEEHLATICEALQEVERYRDMEEQGRLHIFPCAVGDKVHFLWNTPEEDRYHGILAARYDAEVKEISIGIYHARKDVQYKIEPVAHRGEILKFYSDDIGKRLFTDREEAEKKLAELNEAREQQEERDER